MDVFSQHGLRRLRAPGVRLRAAAATGLMLAPLALAACGGSSSSSGSAADPTTPETGKQVFASAGCGSCHTLAAAGSNGNIGPNLDTLKPSYLAVVHQVTNGGGGMPSFKGQLSRAEIASVAQYIVSVTH